jgi:hypothetical protein
VRLKTWYEFFKILIHCMHHKLSKICKIYAIEKCKTCTKSKILKKYLLKLFPIFESSLKFWKSSTIFYWICIKNHSNMLNSITYNLFTILLISWPLITRKTNHNGKASKISLKQIWYCHAMDCLAINSESHSDGLL